MFSFFKEGVKFCFIGRQKARAFNRGRGAAVLLCQMAQSLTPLDGGEKRAAAEPPPLLCALLRDFLHGVSLDNVPFLDIVEFFYRHAALVVLGNFLDGVFKPLKGG